MKRLSELKKGLCMAFLWVLASITFGQNPVITHIFTSDPAALVYGDSVYLYTGHDEASISSTGFVMNNWHVFSSADMLNWKDHGPVLSVSDFTWAVANAWAGQCVERDGKFYWYVPMSHRTISGFSIGVAVADNPLGPYTDALGIALITNNMTTNTSIDWDDIDPSVFIDDDGQAYLFWGNTSCKYVKLKDNMIELDGDIQYVSLPGFTEAPWIHKHNDLYYLTYAALYPEEIHYAVSDTITGPWIYKGRLNQTISNSPTNHQSIIEFKNQWYYIYHTANLPTGGEFRRSVAIDYMYYNPDGSIMQIVQTSYGIAHADSTSICSPVPLTASAKVNNGNFTSNRTYNLIEDDIIILSPESSEEGEWSWIGPGDFTHTGREITLTDLKTDQSGNYMAIFTNNCRTKSYMSFDLIINPDKPKDIVSGNNYIIKPRNSEMAITVQNASTANGANIIQSVFNNTNNQHWKLTNITGVYWNVCPLHVLSRGLDVNNFSQDDGAKIQIWDYWGGTTQQWQIIEQETGIYQFKARHSGKCLEISGTTTTDNALTRQWTCNNSERQQFTLTSAGVPTLDEEVNFDMDFIKIYPNPYKKGNLNIDLSGIKQPLELFISDLNSKLVYRNTNPENHQIIRSDLDLNSGIYIVKVINESSTYFLKFVHE